LITHRGLLERRGAGVDQNVRCSDREDDDAICAPGLAFALNVTLRQSTAITSYPHRYSR